MDLDDIDLTDSDNEEKPEDNKQGNDDWGNSNWGDDGVVDSWEDAPDYEELERKKKAEEEAKIKEEDEKKRLEEERKLALKIKREQLKQLKNTITDKDESGLFDVNDIEIIHENAQKMDFQTAQDVFGMDIVKTDVKGDIFKFVPMTIGDFNGYHESVLQQVAKLGSKDKLIVMKELLKAMIDDYKAVQIKDVSNYLLDLYNEKIGKKAPKHQAGHSDKAFTNTKDDGKDDFDL